MSKKTKKLGVKTKNAAVFDDEKFDNKDLRHEYVSNGSGIQDVEDPELEQICSTIDKLTLDMFILMQDLIQKKLNLESCMTDGELHLSKSRYILGHKNVSSLQLPTEISDDIDPSVTITEIGDEETMFGKPKLEVNIEDFTSKNSDENDKNIQDPVKWFGVLVPRDIRNAQNKFRDAIESVVDCANTQIRLHETCVKIKQLKNLKKEIIQANED